ncbi:MAG: hypothetical protein V4531_08100 [Actinomycetota bacterium]
MTTVARTKRVTADRRFEVPPSTDFIAVLRAARERFFTDPNVIGVDIGPRRVRGEIQPGENALIVYVLQKLPDNAVGEGRLIPGEFEGLGTDVVEPISPSAPTSAVDYVHDHRIMHDMSSIDWGRLHELAAADGEPIVAHASPVQDFGDVCVVGDDGTLVKTAPNGQQYIDFVRGYQLFRTLHGDDYDFVTFVTDSASGLPPQGGSSFWSGIYNGVQGIGLGPFNGRAAWGTARLQGFHFMNQGHFSLWRYVMLQEFGHQFAAFARYRDPVFNATMTDHLLGGVLGHWALNLDDDRSPMDYDDNDWIELTNGSYRKVSIPSDQRIYSNLDLYLMGLLGPTEVGEFTLLRNVQPVTGSTTDFTATPARLNVQNFIAQEGNRIPTVAAAPKYWRQAFIVLTRDIHRVATLVETVDLLRQRWERDFVEASKGLGRIDTVLDDRPGRITPAQIRDLIGGGYTGLHRHQITVNDLRVVGTQFTGSLGVGQERSWFTWGWPPQWLVTWSLQPTTVSGKIRWTVEVERGSAGLTYLIKVTNVGPVATSFEAKYALAQ